MCDVEEIMGFMLLYVLVVIVLIGMMVINYHYAVWMFGQKVEILVNAGAEVEPLLKRLIEEFNK